MITHKDRQMGLTIMKSARDMANPKRGVYDHGRKSDKGGMPRYDDSQRSRNRSSSEEVHKRSDELQDGSMPQCDDP